MGRVLVSDRQKRPRTVCCEEVPILAASAMWCLSIKLQRQETQTLALLLQAPCHSSQGICRTPNAQFRYLKFVSILYIPSITASAQHAKSLAASPIITPAHILITSRITCPHNSIHAFCFALHPAPCSPFITTARFITCFIRWLFFFF